MKDTIEIPRGWLKRLIELSHDLGGLEVNIEGAARISHLRGYIESTESLVESPAITPEHPNDKAQNSEARTDRNDDVVEDIGV